VREPKRNSLGDTDKTASAIEIHELSPQERQKLIEKYKPQISLPLKAANTRAKPAKDTTHPITSLNTARTTAVDTNFFASNKRSIEFN
jgi:hypothetical protein